MKTISVLLLLTFSLLRLPSQEAPVKWLAETPELSQGQSWGIPWTKGAVTKDRTFVLKAASGKTFPIQTWPLAYWPDGSIKWSGMAASLPAKEEGPFTVQAAAPFTTLNGLTATQDEQAITIDNGAMKLRIPRSGNKIIDQIEIDGKPVVSGGRLVCILETGNVGDATTNLRYEEFSGQISGVTLEQNGPVRAVVKIEGKHASTTQNRSWLPFTVRLYIYAHQQDIKLVHTIIYDGNQDKDFIKGLGIIFQVPLREEIQNRHVRFSGQEGGLWSEPIQPLDGRRFITHADMRSPYTFQLQGIRIPDKESYTAPNQKLLTDLAVWDDFKLNQLSPNGFTIVKRTGNQSSWLASAAGKRAEGLAFVGDVSGGLAVSLKNFWQSFPAALEIHDARSKEAQLKVWMWSPDAEAMDLRHYDTIAHDLNSSYEDVQEGLSTPYGVARTSELTLFVTRSVPSKVAFMQMSRMGAVPQRLVSTPQHFHKAGAFGNLWSLPDRSNPTRLWMENQLDSSILYYKKMVDQHHWYGFWNYGDIMHSQDVPRHVWRYDIGGMAWDNSELAPDLWLWYSFLRSGDANSFKLAEAMTRHTSEVDCYHLGELQGLGSRHNVSHWGCGAKEARIGQAAFRRFYYYLTTDERVGDVMREMLNGDKATVVLDPMRIAMPVSVAPVDAPTRVRFGPDWISFVANWMTEWERTGDTRWRDRITTGMSNFAAMPNGLFSGKGVFGYDPATAKITLADDQQNELHSMHLATIMGGAEMMFELFTFLDHKEFEKAWLQYCEYYSMPRNDSARTEKTAKIPSNGFLVPRLTAYAAMILKNEKLAARAWSEFLGRTNGYSMYATKPVNAPDVLNPIDENGGISTNSVAQWGLNAIFMPAMIGQQIPALNNSSSSGGGMGFPFGMQNQPAPAQPAETPQILPEVGPAPAAAKKR